MITNHACAGSGGVPPPDEANKPRHSYFCIRKITTLNCACDARAGRRDAAPPCASVVFSLVLLLAIFTLTACSRSAATASIGADTPWTTYEAESMRTNGEILGPKYEPFLVETESSNQRCVRLASPDAYIEFTATAAANALVLRYSLPDSPDGNGTSAQLALLINGKQIRTLALNSHYSHLYGNYPFTNNPADAKPRNFYDELRVKDLTIAKGDTIRFEWHGRLAHVDGKAVGSSGTGDSPVISSQTAKPMGETPMPLDPLNLAASVILDLIDLENISPPLAAPANALSLRDYGARGDGTTDDTAALRTAITAAQKHNKTLYIPTGDYLITGDIILSSAVTIQGAGMWHTNFIGDPALYSDATRRVRFKLAGRDIHLADFAITGRLNYRNDDEPNDGIIGAGCTDCTVSRIWIEHTKCGAWIYNGTRLRVDGCRFRNVIADGINLCVGTNNSIVENCTARGCGDDCFAIWPAAFDQGYVGEISPPGNNIIRRCTGSLAFLANGVSIYGGANNRIEDCLFTDMTAGCGVLISTTFPTSDDARGIDNNFSGTTTIQNIRLERCGGYDHGWTWRGSFQICMHRRSISGLRISNIEIRDSLSDGLAIIAPGKSDNQGTLSDTHLEKITIINSGIGVPSNNAHRRNIWVREDVEGKMSLHDIEITKPQNDSPNFTILDN